MNYLSKSYVSLEIFGDNFSPNDFTSIIGVIPTGFGVKGQKGKYISSLKENFWQFQLSRTNTHEGLHESIKEMIKIFSSKANNIKKFVKLNNLNVKIFVVIESKNDENNGVIINANFIEFLKNIEGSIEVCIYNE